MIEVFEGTLGGGKTYNSVRRMARVVSKGGYVFTNVEIQWEGFSEYVRQIYRVNPLPEQVIQIPRDGIEDFHKYLKSGTDDLPVLAVLDEIDLWFNARDHAAADKFHRKLFEFLKLSRKAKVDIIFIAQARENINRQFVRLVEFVWQFRDMRNLKVPILGNWIGWFLKGYIAEICYNPRVKGGAVESRWVKKDKRIFAAYNTNAIICSAELPDSVCSPLTLERIPVVNAAKLRAMRDGLIPWLTPAFPAVAICAATIFKLW